MKPADQSAMIARLPELLAAGRIEEMFEELSSLLAQMSHENMALQLRMMKLLKHSFGRKSEKLSVGNSLDTASPAGNLPQTQPLERRGPCAS